jgi:hypothetical protein
MADVTDRGFGGMILEAVPLEGGNSTVHHNILHRPKNSLIVDLAVVEWAISAVKDHFSSVPLPLNDVSLVFLNEDPNDPRTLLLQKHSVVHNKYLQQYAKRLNAGNTPDVVLFWYHARLDEISTVMMMETRGMGI